jgi:hypothetical protein
VPYNAGAGTVSHGPHTFRESDLVRALKAAKKAGVRVRVEIEPGNKLAVTMLSKEEQEAADRNHKNTWDDV